MGNKKNTRQRIPTAKKRAANSEEDSDSPRHTSTRPKPRPNYKGASTINVTFNTSPHADIGSGVDKVSDVIAQTSKKAVKNRRFVTDPDNDINMAVDEDAMEDEVIELEEEEDETWGDLNEEDVDVEEAIVSKGRQHKATAPGM